MKTIDQCPNCGSRKLSSLTESTADPHPPAREVIKLTCPECGWAMQVERQRGATVSARVTNPGKPT